MDGSIGQPGHPPGCGGQGQRRRRNTRLISPMSARPTPRSSPARSPAAASPASTPKAAEAVPGVQMILTHHSLNEGLGEETFAMKGGHMQSSFMPLTSDEVHYAGQIVSLVIADTQEAMPSRPPASWLWITRPSTLRPRWTIPATKKSRWRKKRLTWAMRSPRSPTADVSVDATYLTPAQHHNPIELYAATCRVARRQAAGEHAEPVGEAASRRRSPRYSASRWRMCISNRRSSAAGSAARRALLAHTVLVAMAARRLGRPVKLVVPREAMFTVGSVPPRHAQPRPPRRRGRTAR